MARWSSATRAEWARGDCVEAAGFYLPKRQVQGLAQVQEPAAPAVKRKAEEDWGHHRPPACPADRPQALLSDCPGGERRDPSQETGWHPSGPQVLHRTRNNSVTFWRPTFAVLGRVTRASKRFGEGLSGQGGDERPMNWAQIMGLPEHCHHPFR